MKYPRIPEKTITYCVEQMKKGVAAYALARRFKIDHTTLLYHKKKNGIDTTGEAREKFIEARRKRTRERMRLLRNSTPRVSAKLVMRSIQPPKPMMYKDYLKKQNVIHHGEFSDKGYDGVV